MTNVIVARIMDSVRLQAPGALEGTLRLEFFNTLKEFLQRSDIWREDITVPTVANWEYYELPALSQGLVNRLIWLEGPRPTVSSGVPQYGSPRNGHLERTGRAALLKIYPPSTTETWIAHVALTIIDPTDSEGLPSMPDWAVEKYQDYITSGLLSRLAMQPGKPYSNEKLVMYHGRRFLQGIALAKKEAQQGHTFGGQRWAYPQSFASYSQKFR